MAAATVVFSTAVAVVAPVAVAPAAVIAAPATIASVTTTVAIAMTVAPSAPVMIAVVVVGAGCAAEREQDDAAQRRPADGVSIGHVSGLPERPRVRGHSA